MTIVWAAIESPWGPIHLAATSTGLAELDLLTPEAVFSDRLARRFAERPCRLAETAPSDPAARLAEAAIGQVAAYLAGGLRRFELPLDLADRPAWDRAVLEAVAGIPFGETISYGGVARRIGRTGAARAVGGAVGRNPIGLVIPCHRVIAADGSLGGYGGDWWGGREERLAVKRALLAGEGSWDPMADRPVAREAPPAVIPAD